MASGPSDKAFERLHGAERRKDLTDAYDRALLRAYPIIRAEVIAEVVEAVRKRGPHTYPAQSNYNCMQSYGDFIEQEFKDD